jgi:1-acyl-sn-glycerol-3-phosphate acyltransferase
VDLISAGAKVLELAATARDKVSHFISDEDLDRRLERLGVSLGPYGVDPFGFDPQTMRHLIAPLAWMYRSYFRCETFGLHNVPQGSCLLVANHSGQLPYDGAMLAMALFLEREPPLFLRSMVERFVPSTPFVSPLLARCGQVLGTPENCRRLLQANQIIQIFPEGVAGLNKTWRHRYRLQRFGTGFMRLAIEQQTPVVPVVLIGAEEQAPSLYNMRSLGRMLGLPALPLTVAPGFGLLPLPSRYRMHFGAPLHFTGDANDEDEVICRKVAQVREVMQGMLDSGLSARQHVFW